MPQGNPQAYRSVANALASRGRHGDTMLAHINPQEAQVLKGLGGSGTINPDTGLPEFFLDTASSVAGILSDVGSVAAPIISAVQQSEAADAAGERSEQAQELAQQGLDLQKANRIDARGNVLRYNEETNTFEVIPSPTTQDIIEAQDAEMLKQLTTDAARNRQIAERTNRIGRQAAPVTSAGLRELQQPDEYTPSGIEGTLAQRALHGIDQAYDGTEQAAARSFMRTGGDPTGRTFDDLAEGRAEANQGAMMDAAVRSLGLASDLNAADDQRSQQNIASTSGLASGGRVNVANPQIGGQLSRALSGRQSGASVAAQNAAGTFGQTAQIPTTANTGINIGGAIAGGGALIDRLAGVFGGGNDSTPSLNERRRSGNTTSGTFQMPGGGLTF